MAISKDFSFIWWYSAFTTTCHILLGFYSLFSLPLTLEVLGETIASMPALALFTCLEIFKIFVAKRFSGNLDVFTLPQYTNPVRGDPNKGPLLRRIVLRFKKFIFRLKPVKSLLKGCLFMLASWMLFGYVTICFGAPVLSAHSETAAFTTLISIWAALPPILIYGPDTLKLKRGLLIDSGEADQIGQILFRNGLGALLGAWLGAFPIPLDWDRPWQVWPIPCALGAYIGFLTSSTWSFFILHRRCLRSSVKSSKKTH